MLQQYLPFTVLKRNLSTYYKRRTCCTTLRLQQYLPFTVLKLYMMLIDEGRDVGKLQQYLPFTVLKLILFMSIEIILESCNSTYRLRY